MKPLLCVLAMLAPSVVLAQGYRIAATYPIGGVGSYDYIRYDADGGRLFVSHQTAVEVLSADTGKPLGRIGDLSGVHGIALAQPLGRGYITNGGNGKVTVFDLKTLAVLGTVVTGGAKPDGIEFDAASGLVIVSNGHSHSVSVIDPIKSTVLHVVPVDGNPESIAPDGAGFAFVNIESKSAVVRIDLAKGTVVTEWSVAPGDGPTGIALDREHHRLVCTCGGNEKAVVLDSRTGRQVAVLAIGDDSDAAGFNPFNQTFYSSNRDGTLSVLHEDDPEHFSVAQTLQTQTGAKTLALDLKGDRVFLPVAQLGPGPDEDHPGPAVPGTFKVLVATR